jgi:hypothetical protein
VEWTVSEQTTHRPRREYPARFWTDPRVQARMSPIGGRGAFATSPIRAGETLQMIGGTLVDGHELARIFRDYTAAGRYCDAAQVDENLHLADLAASLTVPLNHSCDPNAWMADEVTVVARRDIAAGEEVTVDYALQSGQPVDLVEAHCRCGSAACRHTITGDDWRIPELQTRYAGHFSPFLERRIAAVRGT